MGRKKETNLSKEDAQQVLQNVFAACSTSQNTVPLEILEENVKLNRLVTLFTRLIAVVGLAVLILLLCFALQPQVSCSQVPSDTGAACVQVDVASLFPVSRVSFTLNDQELSYTQSGSSYLVPVTQRGTFTAEITSLNRVTATSTLDIQLSSVQKPHVAFLGVQDGCLAFQVYPGDFQVDFAGIYRQSSRGVKTKPLSVDRETSLVLFEQTAAGNNFFFPDTAGNVLQVVLTSKEPD